MRMPLRAKESVSDGAHARAPVAHNPVPVIAVKTPKAKICRKSALQPEPEIITQLEKKMEMTTKTLVITRMPKILRC